MIEFSPTTWWWSDGDGITARLTTAATDHRPTLDNIRKADHSLYHALNLPHLFCMSHSFSPPPSFPFPPRHPSGVCDTFESGVWEPTINKRNSLRSATEAACLILSIDETVKNPQVPLPYVRSLDLPADPATTTCACENVL